MIDHNDIKDFLTRVEDNYQTALHLTGVVDGPPVQLGMIITIYALFIEDYDENDPTREALHKLLTHEISRLTVLWNEMRLAQ